MANLKNSQRISYKATYVQISPKDSSRPGTGVQRLKRPLEKAAFLQSLNIRSAEVDALAKNKEKFPAALISAVNKMVSDPSGMSTLNSAALFADIDYKQVSAFASALLDYRTTLAASANRQIADIVEAHKKSFTSTRAVPVTALPEAMSALKGAATESGTTLSGISFKKSTMQTTSQLKTDQKGENESLGFTGILEAARTAIPVTASQVSSSAAVAVPFESALLWAQTEQPKLFNGLYNSLLPYLDSSDDDNRIAGKSRIITQFLGNRFNSLQGKNHEGILAGFQSRMEIEPIGNLHLERIEMYPAGIERGELIHSVPMAPSETVNISHKEWSVTESEFEDIVDDYFEGYSETGVAEKNDMSMSNDSQTKHSTALNLGASLSASYASVTLSTNFGYNATSDDEQSRKDSRNHSIDITKKASARTKKEHKVTFKVTSVTGSEDESVRVISNPSDQDAMRIDYFQLARKWKVDLLRYGLRMTYDIVIPNPGSGIVTKVSEVKSLEALINEPFSFTLPVSAVTPTSYPNLAAYYNANVSAPPDPTKWVNTHKEIPKGNGDFYDDVNFDSIDFAIDENYTIGAIVPAYEYDHKKDDNDSYFKVLPFQNFYTSMGELLGRSGQLSIDFVFQYIWKYAVNISFRCDLKPAVLEDWRLQAWNQLRQAAEDQYNKNLQHYKDLRDQLLEEIDSYDALTLRRMEQEEIMKGVLRWIFGPQFYLVPFDIATLFGNDTNDPGVNNVLDPNRLTNTEWANVLEHGEFIKYIHNAIEWENVLYFTYPYFWDDNSLWDFKKFLFHPDPTHRTFLRAGAARVVLTIRPGFESSFTQLIETGAFSSLPSNHPYVTIAQEIQNFANTNYPGFPPANPEQNARPLVYLEQRKTWKEMQYLIQLLNAFKADPANNNLYPSSTQGLAVLAPYLAATNAANHTANQQQIALDPSTTADALLPESYTAVPTKDIWGNNYFYKFPGDTGDYDLISYGADGHPGGEDKDADISANAEASLISTWYEYTPTNALDIAVTFNKAGTLPAPLDPSIG